MNEKYVKTTKKVNLIDLFRKFYLKLLFSVVCLHLPKC